MYFAPTAEHTYWWPIKIKMPSATKSGAWVTETFEMQFAAVNADEAERIQAEIKAMKPEEQVDHAHDQLLNACRDWRGVFDNDGDKKKEVPFSREILIAMLKAGPWYRQGVYQSYQASLAGDAARSGN
ncbi:hypothetical protein FJ937_16510 [Mesorhizobium sp. B2-4-4]|uniref:hypothetical protein n=1 Tax=unclassified Mesorhizobium TaxID=325217 RepID=UPI00112A7939|nr:MULTISPECIES: hypothetical protein [unclassified Mesorhizobium]TPJ83843.1 hypothetical protein FJ422_16350 [Mesorhizobium sp. B2-6-3]TPL49087.1 hypothetical protein FJ937_16510 [Mesorhizobium sp. B2-4-4]